MTYTEEQVQDIINQNLALMAENSHLRNNLDEETVRADDAEKKYAELCERCIKFYITDRDITTDTIYASVTVPRFMVESELEVALLQNIATMLSKERAREAARVYPVCFKRREDVTPR